MAIKTPGRADLAVDETQRSRGATVGEQPASRPEHEWVDEKQILVDKAVGHQGLDQLAAAHHGQVLPLLLPELRDRLGHITAQ